MTNVNEALYILFGWSLGLLSPIIINAVNAKRRRKEFLDSLAVELVDIQMRILVTGFLLGQRYGTLNREYLVWLQSALSKYKGDEEISQVKMLVDSFVENGVDPGLRERLREEKKGIGLSMKTYSTSYIDSNLGGRSGLSSELQLRIHEFRNCLNVLNQEILLANERQTMTWDSSISGTNHDRLIKDVETRFADIQNMNTRASKKIEAIEALIH